MPVPWTETRLSQVEESAAHCRSGDPCSADVVSLVTEVRRLQDVLREIIWLADATEPLSVNAMIARAALGDDGRSAASLP